MTLLRGLRDDVTLDEWLRKYIFPGKPKNVTEELSAGGAAGGGGTDSRRRDDVRRHVLLRRCIAEETKPRECAAYWAKRFLISCPDNKSNAAMLEYAEKFLKRWQGDALIHAASRRIRLYLFAKDAPGFGALARKYSAPILIHVAEMKKELDDSRAKNGTTPVQYLDKLGILGPDMVRALYFC